MAGRRIPRPDKTGSSDGDTQRGGGRDPFSVQEHIGKLLRDHFDDAVSQPVPEHLRRLLDELEQANKTSERSMSPAEPSAKTGKTESET